jgi:hypothetical protein
MLKSFVVLERGQRRSLLFMSGLAARSFRSHMHRSFYVCALFPCFTTISVCTGMQPAASAIYDRPLTSCKDHQYTDRPRASCILQKPSIQPPLIDPKYPAFYNKYKYSNRWRTPQVLHSTHYTKEQPLTDPNNLHFKEPTHTHKLEAPAHTAHVNNRTPCLWSWVCMHTQAAVPSANVAWDACTCK